MPRSKKEILIDKESNKEKSAKTRKSSEETAKKSSRYGALAEFEKKTSKRATSAGSASKTKKATTATSASKAKKADSSKTTAKRNLKSANQTKLSSSNEALVSTNYNNIVEYYDLPYRYNQTIVKVLAQNPNTLFVYWDISDEDIENFKKEYGENFLYITKPILLVHNLTDNYSFEVEINDFANNWYINVDDTKCEYSVELCRRPNQSDRIENIHTKQSTDFINISYSNTIEMPNDRILYFKDGDLIHFKNIKTNKVISTRYASVSHDKKLKAIYSNYNLSDNEDRFDFKNPSSQNPTSNVM